MRPLNSLGHAFLPEPPSLPQCFAPVSLNAKVPECVTVITMLCTCGMALPFLPFSPFMLTPFSSLDFPHLSHQSFLWLQLWEKCCSFSEFPLQILLRTVSWKKTPSKCPVEGNKNGLWDSCKSVIPWVWPSPPQTYITVLSRDTNALILPTRAPLAHHLACWLSPMPSAGSVPGLGCPSSSRALGRLCISSQMQHPLKSFFPFPRGSWTFSSLCSNATLYLSLSKIYSSDPESLLAYLSHLTVSVSRTETCLPRQE